VGELQGKPEGIKQPETIINNLMTLDQVLMIHI